MREDEYDDVARLYSVWRNMKARCEYPRSRGYVNYGGRGITVCEEWQRFGVFAVWAMDNGYAADLEIDRQDNDGLYSPQNCKFVTKKINARNKRTTHWITAWGETKSLVAWMEDDRAVVSDVTIRRRIKAGWSPEQALSVLHARDHTEGTFSCGCPRTEDNVYRRKGSGFRMCKRHTKARAAQQKRNKKEGLYDT